MSDVPKRPGYDPVALAEAMRAITGPIDPGSSYKPNPNMHAQEVVDKAFEALVSSGAEWHAPSSDIYRYLSAAVGNVFIKLQAPFSGASLGPNYVLQIWDESETVLLAKWFEQDSEDKMIFAFRPGAWLASL